MFESLEIFEFPLGCLVTFSIRLVKDFHAADFTALVDIGSNIETAFGKVAEEVHFSWNNRFGSSTYSHLSNKREVTLTDFEKFHLPQKK